MREWLANLIYKVQDLIKYKKVKSVYLVDVGTASEVEALHAFRESYKDRKFVVDPDREEDIYVSVPSTKFVSSTKVEG